MSRKIKNRIGIRYGRLIVIKFANRTWNGKILWLCKCNCGKEIIVWGNNLQSGNVKSCGCLKREIASKTMSKQTGKNNHRYIDGKYCGKYTKEILKLKEKIRKIANYKCQNCDKTQKQNLKETGEVLSVHHIDGDDTNNAENNLITFCLSCHIKLHEALKRNKV